MYSQISEKEIIVFLKEIESGKIKLIPEEDPFEVYSGNVKYRASNGWELIVFNDANTWDYIDSIKTSDGRFADFDTLDEMEMVRNYCPPLEISATAYKIPKV